MRLLLIEDDKELCSIIQKFLEKNGFVCDVVYNLHDSVERLKKDEQADLIILDVILPDGNGVEFCKTLRASENSTPIIMLTSKKSTVDTISGLDAGADDYMPKPFSPDELLARIKSILRRPKKSIAEVISCGSLNLNTDTRIAHLEGNEIQLMPKEFSLLEYLMRRKNEVIKKDELLRNVWGVYSNTSSNRLEVYVRYLREKLESADHSNVLIKTIRGKGYMISDE